MKQAGFTDVEHVADTGYNSSPKTKGALVRACKPLASSGVLVTGTQVMGSGTPPIDHNRSEKEMPSMQALIDRAIALGAQKAKLIDTDSIVVQKWVKWKCIYGCPMYGHDGHHPPQTPDIAEAREVIGEYTRAILLNGPDGRLLSEVACRLEAEAYHAGFYKALALIALPAGADPAPQPGGG